MQNCRHSSDENEINLPVNERRNDLSEINGHRFFARPSVLSRHAGVPPSFGQRANAFERAVQKSALGFPATTSDQHRASKLERRLHLSHSRMFSLSTMSNHLSHELRQMMKNGGGAIVNQSSVTSSLTGVPGNGLYAATKGAVIALTK
ncbi:MAG: hypothetical protein DME89_12110, partial [Verrucomicrobia bacterium]